MSNLSELLPAGGGGKNVDFVASGTLASGQTVVLKADGTVEAAGTTAVPDSAGTAVNFDSQQSTYISTAYSEDAQKIIISYRSSSGYGTAVVGTVSGTSISFGSPVVFLSSSASFTTTAYDPSTQKVVIGYHRPSNGYAYAIVGTISGSSISFGSASNITTDYGYQLFSTYDTNAQKVVIAFSNATSSDFGKAVVCTISGTNISFGAATTFNNSTGDTKSIIYDAAAQKVVIFYANLGSSNYGTAIVGTVSGTSISFGTPVVFQSSGVDYTSGSYDPNSQKVIVGYHRTNLGGAAAVVGTVSGTSISFGTPVVFETKNVNYISNTYDLNAQKVVIYFRDEYGTPTSEYGYAIVGTVSGTSISFGTASVFFTSVSNWIVSVYDTAASKVVIAFHNNIFQGPGKAVVWTTGHSATNSADFIGITDQAIADTATGAVIVQGGVSEKLSGLTVGADYYVQADGSLASGSIPYDISSASFVQSFSVSAQETAPHGVAFNTDGTKMFIVGSTGDDVNEYALSTVFDVSTASFTQNFSVASQENGPYAIAFNTNGTKMFILGVAGDDVNEYTLSTGFDISTASFVDSFSVSAQDTLPLALAFSTDGTKMFVVGATGVDVNEYTLSTGFDVSTASFVVSFSVSSQDTGPAGIAFNNDGTQMFISGQTADSIHKYTLTTGFSVSTASFLNSFSVASQDSSPRGLAFSANGTKMFVVGGAGVDVNEYATTAASTTVPAGRALSSTSILLEG